MWVPVIFYSVLLGACIAVVIIYAIEDQKNSRGDDSQ